MNCIQIRDLKIRCIVGVHLHERKSEQDLIIDLDLDLDFSNAAKHDSLDYTLDYTLIAERLEAFCQHEKFQLIETLAVRACDLILEDWKQVRKCRIVIKKPMALPQAAYAGVTVEREAWL